MRSRRSPERRRNVEHSNPPPKKLGTNGVRGIASLGMICRRGIIPVDDEIHGAFKFRYDAARIDRRRDDKERLRFVLTESGNVIVLSCGSYFKFVASARLTWQRRA